MKSDILIIGAGMAGAAAAYELAGARGSKARVILLEGESRPGYHSTGRSAALYEPGFGNATVEAFNIASAGFLKSPPAGFADRPLLTRRGELTICDGDHRADFERVLALDGLGGHEVREISPERALAMISIRSQHGDDASAEEIIQKRSPLQFVVLHPTPIHRETAAWNLSIVGTNVEAST